MARITTLVGPLSVREVGSGPPAVLWSSLFVDSDSWQRIEHELGEYRHLVLIDGPGHGRSGDPGHRYTQSDCASAAIEVLDELGITRPVDWVGNAWGGHVGIHVATEQSERLRSLVAIGTPVAAYTPAERRRTRLLLAIHRLVGPIGYLQEGVATVLLSPATRAADPEAVAYVKGRLAAADRRMLRNAVESISLARGDVTARLPRIAVPTMFITGSDDVGFTPDEARAAIALVPDGRLGIVPDAAYLPPLERPAEVLRLVLGFWADMRIPDEQPTLSAGVVDPEPRPGTQVLPIASLATSLPAEPRDQTYRARQTDWLTRFSRRSCEPDWRTGVMAPEATCASRPARLSEPPRMAVPSAPSQPA